MYFYETLLALAATLTWNVNSAVEILVKDAMEDENFFAGYENILKERRIKLFHCLWGVCLVATDKEDKDTVHEIANLVCEYAYRV